ncbi:phage tail protein [Comamonas testosteroni]|uniref:Phage tail protein n=1 Tax=Comamonas testosteroni TaxID=285 RepID=A0A373FRX0_COMTE|nr:tail protein X [Comamonas testosteroni]RGE46119.1 phage tail protein [Comamonas testosteroni]
MATQVRTIQGETVDALCWRHYGRTLGMTEAVLQANPGLAAKGLILPQGLLVSMPDLPTPQPKPIVQLWD